MNTSLYASTISSCRLFAASIILCALTVLAFATVHAAEWPERPVKLIVGYSPGGGTDVIARLVSTRLSEILGQPVIVENRPGASGKIGALTVVNAKPDGYTLLFASDPELSIAPVVLKSMSYDPFKDLAPITQIAKGPYVLATNPNFPPNTVSELIAYVKAKPGQVNYGSSGTGTSSHLLGEELNALTNIDAVHIPYKGLSSAVSDLVAGQIQYAFVPPLVVRGFVDAGSLKALAVATPRRLPNMKKIPTTTESGLPGFVGGSWYALLAPAKTPEAIINTIHAAIEKELNSPDMRKAFDRLGVIPASSTPDELTVFMRSEIAKWRRLAQKIGLKPM